MLTVDEFRQKIHDNEAEYLLEHVIFQEEAKHVSSENIQHLRAALADKFACPIDSIKLWIVGSAKLGFSITEKHMYGAPTLPRYRDFSPTSDVDVAVVCPPIFNLIWDELSSHANQNGRLPWDSKELGDYLVYGWLRPDTFPIKARLRRCDDWWDLFHALSADARYGRRKVRGGLFHSEDQMKRYQRRAISECLAAEALIQ